MWVPYTITDNKIFNFMPCFNKENRCNSHNHLNTVIDNLASQLGPDDLLICDGWKTKESEQLLFDYLKSRYIKNIYFVSLADKFQNDYLGLTEKFSKLCDNAHILGHTHPKKDSFYSFWLDFTYTYRHLYYSFDVKKLHHKPKTFMCLNRKPHHHRHELWKKIHRYKLGKHGHISFHNQQQLPLDVPKKTTFESEVLMPNDIESLGHPSNWNTHFLNIVTETQFGGYDQFIFFSEKTFKPIIGHRPFIILGGPNKYHGLQELGFDTFDDIFGTGYKSREVNDVIKWIIDVLKCLKKTNKVALYKKLLPRLAENYNVFLKVAKENQIRRDNLCLSHI